MSIKRPNSTWISASTVSRRQIWKSGIKEALLRRAIQTFSIGPLCMIAALGSSIAVFAGIVAVGSAIQLRAQSLSSHSDLLTFEVASVRMVPSRDTGLTSIGKWGEPRFRATHVTLDVLIQLAYGVLRDQISAEPSWLQSQEYDIDAKPEKDRPLTYKDAKPMLQALLRDRFQLVVHREMKETSGYALVVSKNGSKLVSGKGITGQRYFSRTHLSCTGSSLESLVGMLTALLGRPVSDETKLTGNYDITLDYAPMDGTDSSLPSLFTALQEKIGLKLVPQRIPVQILVVDHVNRTPTEN